MIKELKDSDGKRIVEQEELKDHFFQHFRDLYRDTDEVDPLAQAKILSGIPSLITEQDDKELKIPIMEVEIKLAIWSLKADKAPGPDGFTINFYRAAWYTIKDDLKRMLNWTRRKDKVGGATNSSFLTLNPKEKKKTHHNRLF